MLSFDEWNVWYRTHTAEHMRKPGWPRAPALLEEVYTMEDALVVGGALITLMSNADRVKCACLAQLCNVIGAIMTETGGPAWRQTIFHPFALAARYGHGRVMRAKVDAPPTSAAADAPCLLASVTEDPRTGASALFALNRHPSEALDLDVELRGLGRDRHLVEALELHHPNLKAANTRDAPEAVAPKRHDEVAVSGERLRLRLKPLSWTVIASRAERTDLPPGVDADVDTGHAGQPLPQTS